MCPLGVIQGKGCSINVMTWKLFPSVTGRFPSHGDVIKRKHFPRYWPFVQGIHRSPVNSPHKGQWHEALTFSLICAWTNGKVNNRDAGDLRRNRAHYDVTVMTKGQFFCVILNKVLNKQSIYDAMTLMWHTNEKYMIRFVGSKSDRQGEHQSNRLLREDRISPLFRFITACHFVMWFNLSMDKQSHPLKGEMELLIH